MSMSDSSTAQPTVRNFFRMPNLSAEIEWLSPVSACALETCLCVCLVACGLCVCVGGVVSVCVCCVCVVCVCGETEGARRGGRGAWVWRWRRPLPPSLPPSLPHSHRERHREDVGAALAHARGRLLVERDDDVVCDLGALCCDNGAHLDCEFGSVAGWR